MYDQAVLIGRFQPFHNEHLKLLERTLKEAHHVTILLGSHNASRNFRNPWTCQERQTFILNCLTKEQADRVNFHYIRDYLYNDANWIAQVQQKVRERGLLVRTALEKDSELNVCLAGSKKDNTSQYLDYFPAWRKVGGVIVNPMNATDIRERFFNGMEPHWEVGLPPVVAAWLTQWQKDNPEIYTRLMREQGFIMKYKRDWQNAPFPPVFVTVDAVVVCGGHVLVIRRGGEPGKGLFALPGGFIDQNETIAEAVIRELTEETNILIPREVLVNCRRETKVFDHPLRSLRGRTITHTTLFVLPQDHMPRIKAGDDAAACEWMSLSDLQSNESEFYEDHFHMINHFTSRL